MLDGTEGHARNFIHDDAERGCETRGWRGSVAVCTVGAKSWRLRGETGDESKRPGSGEQIQTQPVRSRYF